MKKIRSLKEVLNNLILTEEERKLLEAWVPYLEQEQHDELIDEAWQAGAKEYFAELAYDNLFPVYVRAIELTLRADQDDTEDSKLTAAEELEIQNAQMEIQHFEEVAQENLDRFFGRCCVDTSGQNDMVRVSELRSVYERWCQKEDGMPLRSQDFECLVEQRGLVQKRVRNPRTGIDTEHWLRLRLKPEWAGEDLEFHQSMVAMVQ